MDDFAQAQGQVRSAMMCMADRTSSTGNSATGASAWALEIEGAGTDPGSLQFDVFQAVFDQLANAPPTACSSSMSPSTAANRGR